MKKIQEYHDMATMARDRGEILSETKLQEYGWVGSQISLINIALKYMMLYFPLAAKLDLKALHFHKTGTNPCL